MKKHYYFKLIALLMCGLVPANMALWAMMITLGHILDLKYPAIEKILFKKLEYQEMIDDVFYLLAYNNFRLGLSANKSFEYLESQNHMENPSACKDLFCYYENLIRRRKEYNRKRVNEILTAIYQRGENIAVFQMIEGMFDWQVANESSQHIMVLKQIAQDFRIDYNRNQKYTHQDKMEYQEASNFHQYDYSSTRREEPKQKNYTKSSNSKAQSKPSIAPEIQAAFDVLGLKYSTTITFAEVKKVNRKKAMKLHPDILKGQNASDKKLKSAEKELAEINKATDIIKKFLANN